jgi:hypothetical protein
MAPREKAKVRNIISLPLNIIESRWTAIILTLLRVG